MLSNRTQGNLLRHHTAHGELGSTTVINNQDGDILRDLLTSQYYACIFSVKSLSFSICLDSCHVDKITFSLFRVCSSTQELGILLRQVHENIPGKGWQVSVS